MSEQLIKQELLETLGSYVDMEETEEASAINEKEVDEAIEPDFLGDGFRIDIPGTAGFMDVKATKYEDHKAEFSVGFGFKNEGTDYYTADLTKEETQEVARELAERLDVKVQEFAQIIKDFFAEKGIEKR